MKGLFRSGAVVAGTLLLVACGGGGSGSSDSGGEETSPGTKLSLDTKGYASKTVTISTDTDIDSIAQLNTDLNEAFEVMDIIEDKAIDAIFEAPYTRACPGGGTTTLVENASTPNVDDSFTFDNCVVDVAGYGPLLFSGSYREVKNLKDEKAINRAWVGYQLYDITGEVKNTGETFALKGRFERDESYSSDATDARYHVVLGIAPFEFQLGDRYVALVDQKSEQDGDEYDITVDVSSRWVGSAIGGYVLVSTPTPITYLNDDFTCPTDGVMRFESDGVAEFRYGPSASGTAQAMAIWLNDQLVASYDSCDDIEFSPAE
ncbi:hypothetical protein RE428_43850 [Marinobacter nanhaiticus D15-8W]|uniref:Uncharacterized protein n=1 Tax=Marinobacter nanhaiticus D15-8W TaxID=626887 RepID=N6VZS3_9GAMM|nr:hypothetical protein [Marinobacter nanhaiticus]ENO15775.1 hypothetical protein J057_10501 [Marinobacter nanhaiticus D15-8W]BES73367.1 hypothetical protein RE428_43850 [Marinobacter nanhaiticus D15-8W]